MRASIDLLNGAVLVKIFGRHDENYNRVIIGGSDGVLITLGADGKPRVTPPEGPGDPEARDAIQDIYRGVSVLGTKVHPVICQVLAEQIGAVGNQIFALEREGVSPDSSQVRELTAQLAKLESTYEQEGCGGPVKSPGRPQI